MQLTVLTFNINYDRKERSHSVSCRHFQAIFLCLPVEDLVFSFCMNQRKEVVTSVNGVNGRSIQTLLREVKTTRSNRLKFRLYGSWKS